MYFVTINSDDLQILPKKICRKCYSAISNFIERKSTISTSPFNNWARYAEISETCVRESN